MGPTKFAVEEVQGPGWTILDYDRDADALLARVKKMCQRENGGLWEGRYANIQLVPTRNQLRSRYHMKDWQIDLALHEIDESRGLTDEDLDPES